MKALRHFIGRIGAGKSPMFAVLLTIGTQGLVVGLNVATGVITARLLGADGRGIFTAATIWPQFLAGFAGLGLPTAIIYYMRNHVERRPQISGAAYLLTTIAAVLATIIGLFAAPMFMVDAQPGTIWLAQFCILWLFTNMYTVTLRQMALAEGAFQLFALSNYLTPLSYLVLLLVTWAAIGLTPVSAAVCLMLSSAAGLVWTMIFARNLPRPRLRDSLPWVGRLLHYAGRFAPSDVSGSLLAYIDRLVLIPLITPAELGLYVVAYSLSRLMLVLQVAVQAVLYPSMTGRPAADMKILHDLAFRLILYAGAAAVAVTFLMAPVALRVVYGPDFASAGLLLRILMIEAALSCLAQVTINLYLSLERPGTVSLIQVICLLVATLSLLALVPHYGAAGAAVALMLTGVVRLALLLGGMAALFQMRMPGLIPTATDLQYIRAKLS